MIICSTSIHGWHSTLLVPMKQLTIVWWLLKWLSTLLVITITSTSTGFIIIIIMATIIILARGSQAHPYRDELEAPLGHEAFGNFYYLLTSVFVSFSSIWKIMCPWAEQRKSPLQRATYEYLRGKILDVFPDYRKEAEDHLSKAVSEKKLLVSTVPCLVVLQLSSFSNLAVPCSRLSWIQHLQMLGCV